MFFRFSLIRGGKNLEDSGTNCDLGIKNISNSYKKEESEYFFHFRSLEMEGNITKLL